MGGSLLGVHVWCPKGRDPLHSRISRGLPLEATLGLLIMLLLILSPYHSASFVGGEWEIPGLGVFCTTSLRLHLPSDLSHPS